MDETAAIGVGDITLSESRSLSDRIAWLALHALVFSAPIVISNVSWTGSDKIFALTYDQFEMAKVFVIRLLSLLAAGAFGASLLSGRRGLRKTKTCLLVAAFVLWVALTTVSSLYPAQSILGTYWRYEGLFTFINYALVFFLALQLVDSAPKARSLAITLVASAALVSVYGVIQFFQVDPLVWQTFMTEPGRAFSTYGNPDLLAGFLIFPLILSAALALTETHAFRRVLLWVAFSLSALALLATFVRGAWIAALISFALLVAVTARLKIRPTRQDLVFIVLAVLLVGAAVASTLFSAHEATNVAARTSSLARPDKGSVATRLMIWQGAVGAIRERPLLGSGPDTFALAFTPHEPLAYPKAAGSLDVPDNAHNYPLQIAVTLGLPGLLLLYGFFAWALISSGRATLRRSEPQEKLLYASFWLAVVGYLLHLMAGLSIPSLGMLLWLSLGLLLAPLATVTRPVLPRPAIVALAVIGLLLIAVAAAGTFLQTAADYYLALGSSPGLPAGSVEKRERAVALNPYFDQYRIQAGLLYKNAFLSMAQQGGKGRATLEQKTFAFERAKDSLCDVIERNPYDFYPYLELASVYNAAGERLDKRYASKAIEAAGEGIKLAPVEPDLRYEVAKAYAIQGKTEASLETARRLLRLDPRHVYTYLLLAEIYRREGRLLEARKACRTALQIDATAEDMLAPVRIRATKATLKAIETSLAASSP